MLRANPGYELVMLDRLTAFERELLESELELYGVLRPLPGAVLELRGASADTALLFLTLREPAVLPSYVSRRLGADTERTVARLVLDGVLEIEHDGEFLSGAPAAAAVLSGPSAGGRGRIGELSRAALSYGQQLAAGGIAAGPLGARLYCYGRRPVTAALDRRLGDPSAIDGLLGVDRDGAARRALDAGWVNVPDAPGERNYWRTWRARSATRGSTAAYKLYVSPAVEEIGTAVAAVAESLATARGVVAFKVAGDAGGLSRPDKLVVYFDRLDDLQGAAATVRERLDGCPAHGVAFTAAVTSDGLLSWGADPPLGRGEATSWRLWVSERLAEYLVSGGSSEIEPHASEIEPQEFALARLRLAGIDTDTWIPASGMWEEALAGA